MQTSDPAEKESASNTTSSVPAPDGVKTQQPPPPTSTADDNNNTAEATKRRLTLRPWKHVFEGQDRTLGLR